MENFIFVLALLILDLAQVPILAIRSHKNQINTFSSCSKRNIIVGIIGIVSSLIYYSLFLTPCILQLYSSSTLLSLYGYSCGRSNV